MIRFSFNKAIEEVYTRLIYNGLPFSKLFLHFSGHGTKHLGMEEYFSQASFLSPEKYQDVGERRKKIKYHRLGNSFHKFADIF